jgi:hypothetical protein
MAADNAGIIDAAGCEAHSHGSIDAVLDKAKKTLELGTDRAHMLRETMRTVPNGYDAGAVALHDARARA